MRPSLARRRMGDPPRPWLQDWTGADPAGLLAPGDLASGQGPGLGVRAAPVVMPAPPVFPSTVPPFVDTAATEAPSARLPRLHARLDPGRIEALRSALSAIRLPGAATALLMLDHGDDGAQLAAALALAWARRDGMTLLVDADLAQPRLHRLFGVDNSPGLGELLDEDARTGRLATLPGASPNGIAPAGIEPCLHGVLGAPDLLLLTAGRLRHGGPQALADALAGPALAARLGGWRLRHAQVVITCSGAARGTPALAIAHAVGQAVLLARSQRTPVAAMHRLIDRLRLLRVAVLGTVLVHG